MHRLRTCAARLRPLTATQAAQTVGQQRPLTLTPTGATRTFHPIRCYTAPVASEPFLNGTSSNYVEEMYYAWLENPNSVHKVRSRNAAPTWWGSSELDKLTRVKSTSVRWVLQSDLQSLSSSWVHIAPSRSCQELVWFHLRVLRGW